MEQSQKYSKLYEVSNKECVKCELAAICNSPCLLSKDVGDVKFMIVGEYPSDMEDVRGDIFLSKGGKLVRRILDDVIEVPKGSYYLTNLVKCAPIKGATVTDENANACVEYFLQEVMILKPLVIVFLGNFVTKYFTGKDFVTATHGKLIESTFSLLGESHQCIVIPTYSPMYTQYNEAALKPFAQDLEKAYLTAFNLGTNAKAVPFKYCRTVEDVEQLCDYVEQAGICVPDFETIGVDTYASDFYPTMLSISFQLGFSYIIPLFHFESWFSKDEVYQIMEIIDRRILQNPNVRKANHNFKYELHVLNWFGIKSVKGKIDDTMLMHHHLDETSRHGLKEIVSTFMPEYAGYEDSIKKWSWDKVPLEELAKYAATDTVMTFSLLIKFTEMLMLDKMSYYNYRNVTIPALVALYEAEREGMKVDVKFLEDTIQEADSLMTKQILTLDAFKAVKKYVREKDAELRQKAIDGLESKLSELREKENEGGKRISTQIKNVEDKLALVKTGSVVYYPRVDYGSPAQLGQLLYSNIGFGFKMPYSRKDRKNMPLTGKDEVVRLGDKTGFIDEFLLYKNIEKMQGTYLKGMHKLLDSNSFLHTSFLLHGTESGRLSSAKPNMQNIPRGAKINSSVAKDLVAKIKKIFIPREEGRCFLQLDYAQAELRIAASFANETTMLKAYKDGKDLHTVTAMSASGLSDDSWAKLSDSDKKEYRSRAKAGNFGLLYGMGAEGFVDYARNNYGVEYNMDEAERYRRKFFNTYPQLLVWHAEYIMRGRAEGFVRTLFGRKRHLPKINDSSDYIKAMDERVAINSPVQGTAGEFTIFALALLRNRLDKRVKLVNTVHDSILYDLPIELLEETVRIAVEACENLPIKKYFGVELKSVGMEVDAEYSEASWKDLEPFKSK